MRGKKKRMVIALLVLSVLLVAFVIWVAIENSTIQLNRITVTNDKLPDNFDGYKILHISDLHNTKFGKKDGKLISLVKKARPNIIAITGDMLDTRRDGYQYDVEFVKQAVLVAPCFFVMGNHEAKSPQYANLKKELINAGVVIIDDDKIDIQRDGQTITLLGINDPLFKPENLSGNSREVTEKRLKRLSIDTSGYNILLSHRPELFDIYQKYGLDVVLCGHAHGGQFRLPFIGGLFAPNQGTFPKYDSGLYTQNNTNMIVSRGVGKSIIPFRINNPPEVIIVELNK